jgi:alpha-galactosidase
VVINLASVDDNDEIYLNGKLIAKYGGHSGNIKNGHYGPRSYTIAANDPAIHWDKENVLAIRIYDTGGNGGIYGDDFHLVMADVMRNAIIDTEGDFAFGEKNMLAKEIKLVTKGSYNYKGTFSVKVTDPETGAIVFNKPSLAADFSNGKTFKYWLQFPAPDKKSYHITYRFIDTKSGKDVVKTQTTPYILTPSVSAKPRINGAAVLGASPGKPIIYLIPATGRKPLTYKATGLPQGLKLDPATGVITGSIATKGNYMVTFTATNKLGTASKKFRFAVGDVIGLTPALGWNSWNAFGLSVDDEKVRVAAREMSAKLAAHGWNYVNIDDGWEAEERAADGKIVTNNKFPDMKGTTDYVHSLGLRMGIYSSPGPRTCGGYLGSWQHEDQDAQTYANWGIDYLKYDWCSYSQIAPRPDLAAMKKPYEVMRKAIDKTNRDILYSFCQYGMGDVWTWGAQTGGNSWRTTGDIEDTWDSMFRIGFAQDKAAAYAQPGHFNDPDMLIVGKVGWGPRLHNTRLTFDEQYAHISLWSLLASPLLIGCDMGSLDRFTLNLLTNDEVLAINQDELGKSARQYIKNDKYQIWIKPLKDGSKAIGLFNMTDKYQSITLPKTDAALKGFSTYRDAWRQQAVASVGGKVAPHGVLLITVRK